MREPFLLLVGYGNASKMLARSLDDMGRRFVVIDNKDARVSAVELDSYRADAPALLGDARDTGLLTLAGLGHATCEGVVALAGDDETNLDVAMTTALLRPDLPVIARSSSRDVAERMRAFHVQEVVNPLDRFGDHLRILLRSPAAYQLMIWLTSAPGTPAAAAVRAGCRTAGGWSAATAGTARSSAPTCAPRGWRSPWSMSPGARCWPARATARTWSRAARSSDAVAFVAATESDTTNLWLVEAARRANPDAFVVALQNRRANAPLFTAVGVDFGLVPAEVIAHEVLARLANPVLMRFLPQVPRQGDAWAADVVDRLVATCGNGTPELWRIRLDDDEAPALAGTAGRAQPPAGRPAARPRRPRPPPRHRPADAAPGRRAHDGAGRRRAAPRGRPAAARRSAAGPGRSADHDDRGAHRVVRPRRATGAVGLGLAQGFPRRRRGPTTMSLGAWGHPSH